MATSYAQDDGFREIQLNGKQLFFLFMATTVVSVVIFLCGVLVGRGVRAGRTAIADATQEQAPTSDVAPVAAAAQSVASDPIAATAPPLPKADDEIRPAELKITATPPAKADAKPTEAKATGAKPTGAKPTEAKPAEAKATAAPAPPKAAATEKADARPAPNPEPPAAKPASPSEPQFVVQVAAVKTRGEADPIVKKMTASGYQAFVSESTAGMFRVRVGPYKVRREAETAADKLKRQELARDIWVTVQ